MGYLYWPFGFKAGLGASSPLILWLPISILHRIVALFLNDYFLGKSHMSQSY
jgi:hypothetical protein